MYLSKLVLNWLNRSVQRDLRNCHDLHRTLMRAFPQVDENPREKWGVLYRVEEDPNVIVIVQSKIEPNWSAIDERYFLEPPSVKRVSEHYAQIENGMTFRFRLLANPTKKIAVKTADGFKKNGRRVPLRADDERLDWLKKQGESGGFELIGGSGLYGQYAVAMTPRTVIGYRGSTADPDDKLKFDGIMFDGKLKVVDADRFRHKLAQGFGPGKAYGFGLLSIARCG